MRTTLPKARPSQTDADCLIREARRRLWIRRGATIWQPGGSLRPLPGNSDWANGFAVTPDLVAYGARPAGSR